jgi:hypothetical protein
MKVELDILTAQIGAVLAQCENDLRLEQAVYGMDSLDELALHRLIADRLSVHYDVSREVHYPSTFGRKLSNRKRCDLVLSPTGAPLRLDSKPPTLFDPQVFTLPQEAFWLEVKSAYQFRMPDVRHSGYGQQWRSAVVEDLRKMDAEPLIHNAALVLIVFTESASILEKDLELLEQVLVSKEVLAGFRQVASVPIVDRIGHRVCSAALWPTIVR